MDAETVIKEPEEITDQELKALFEKASEPGRFISDAIDRDDARVLVKRQAMHLARRYFALLDKMEKETGNV